MVEKVKKSLIVILLQWVGITVKYDFLDLLSNLIWQIKDTIDQIRETFLKCLAVFLIWFTTVFAFGLGIIAVLKVFMMIFK